MSGPLLQVRGLVKRFGVDQGWLKPRRSLTAVDGIDLDVAKGEIFGLVGESGSGKTTAGRSILRLYEPDAGSIQFDGLDVRALPNRELRRLRRRMQIVFQDPGAALNARMRVRALVGEPLEVHGMASGEELRHRVETLLERCGLWRAAASMNWFGRIIRSLLRWSANN